MQPPSAHLSLGSAQFVADPMGALFWPDQHLLIVADLHLEKGSAYAARRIFLPPYDTRATLMALAALIARYAPRRVLALGDSFHDGDASERLLPRDRATLAALQSRRDWIWVAGNHDPVLPADLGGDRCQEMTICGITFRHAADPECNDYEIAGHLHPVARVAGSAGSVRRRCFVADNRRCILPALGAYAGGLNLLDEAFAALFPLTECFAHVLGRDRVYRIAQHRCLPD
ncbi:MAG: ligase-associated DNA damage response endonuclease PdeM [Methylovirgula sp.]